MKIALVEPSDLKHRVRGTGFYAKNLLNSFRKYSDEIDINLVRKIPEDADLVHYPFFEPFFLTLPLFKTKKTVVTVHDLTPLRFSENFPVGIRGSVKWQIQKMSLRRVDTIIADSQNSKNDILKFIGLGEDKVHVIYLAAGEEFKKLKSRDWKSEIIKRYNLPEKFVLYVGDVTWNKNLPRIIEAVKKINIPLVLVGKALVNKDFDKKNPWNQDLIKIQELARNDDRIKILGFVEDSDLVSLYNLATVFVMPSLYEGFGLPILEAMNCGCPVITSKEGSLKEVAGDAVFYVDAYNLESIADGIRNVYENETLAKSLSEKGFLQAKNFSWKKTVFETLGIYKSLL